MATLHILELDDPTSRILDFISSPIEYLLGTINWYNDKDYILLGSDVMGDFTISVEYHITEDALVFYTNGGVLTYHEGQINIERGRFVINPTDIGFIVFKSRRWSFQEFRDRIDKIRREFYNLEIEKTTL